jgi:hypothetical protein
MFTILVKKIKRNRSETAGPNHVSVPSENDIRGGEDLCCFALGGGR